MFNKTEVQANGDDKYGAIAKLLCEKPGEWFTFKDKDGKLISMYTSMVIFISDFCIRCISGRMELIDAETHARFLKVISKYHTSPSA